MAKAECLGCYWEAQNHAKIDTSKSKVAWAEQIGVSEASIRRHLKHSPHVPTTTYKSETDDWEGAASTISSLGLDELLTNLGIPVEAVTSRGASIRDPETGTWQKVTWHPNKAVLINSTRYDDLAKGLDGWTPASPTPTAGGDFTSVLNAADLQIGKAQNRGGGTPETTQRVRNSIEAFARDLIEKTPECLVLVDNGDGIENIWNTPQQLTTNDLSVPEQIRTFRRLMLEAIKTLAPLVPRLIYVAVPSNHGAARVGYKAPGGTVDADFGLEISYQLEDAVRENPFLQHVEFVRPESLDETATVEVSGTKLAFHHGHQSAGPNAHGKWWAAMSHGRMPGWDADILVTAHYHSLRVEHSGNGRWIIGVSSSDAGSDWFTNRTGESAIQGMTAFNVSNGRWSDLRIL